MNQDDPIKNDILLDHDYDGIQELDNPLPRWWVYLFYLTIAFAVGYVGYYCFGPGKSSLETFQADLAQVQGKPVPTDSADQVEEALEKKAHDPQALAAGAALFTAKCAPCHNQQGQGLIGPNLTDAYWIHGKGTLGDIYTAVSDGVPAKGMLAWKTLIKPEEIQNIVVYVKLLRGSHPDNPKAPEGEKVDGDD